MQLPFPTQTYSFLQRKISMHSPQNVEEIPLQHKISTYSPENMDEILLQCKTSTYNPQNVDKILHQHKKRQPHRAAFSLYLSGRN